jgi:hypothetical protein
MSRNRKQASWTCIAVRLYLLSAPTGIGIAIDGQYSVTSATLRLGQTYRMFAGGSIDGMNSSAT